MLTMGRRCFTLLELDMPGGARDEGQAQVLPQCRFLLGFLRRYSKANSVHSYFSFIEYLWSCYSKSDVCAEETASEQDTALGLCSFHLRVRPESSVIKLGRPQLTLIWFNSVMTIFVWISYKYCKYVLFWSFQNDVCHFVRAPVNFLLVCWAARNPIVWFHLNLPERAFEFHYLECSALWW